MNCASGIVLSHFLRGDGRFLTMYSQTLRKVYNETVRAIEFTF